jgi:hypothetical protein
LQLRIGKLVEEMQNVLFLQRIVLICNKFTALFAGPADNIVVRTSGEGTGCCRICMAANMDHDATGCASA